MVELSNDEVKQIVKDNYSKVALNAEASCCDDACCGAETDLYALEQVEGLPTEAVMASAGCGNPTAIGTIEAGETVVDFGSGGGIDCFLAARAVGSEGKVIGVDMTPDMVDLANRNKERLGASNVEFHLTDMEHTPIESDSVDLIVSNCVINLAPDKAAVFNEAYRILKPGGRLFISDMVLVGELPEEAHTSENWVACLSGAEPKETYLGTVSSTGFTDIEIVADTPWSGKQSWASRIHSMNIKAYKPA